MSNPAIEQIRSGKAPSVTELVAETRIDSPHSAALGRPPQAVVEIPPPAGREAGGEGGDLQARHPSQSEIADEDFDLEPCQPEIQVQAAQLAEHLRHRQLELDHREAELNAWAAQLERDRLAARIWLDERNAELEATVPPAETIVLQEDAIRRMAEALAQRQRSLAESEAGLETERAALDDFHRQLTADRQLLEEQSRIQRQRLAAEELRLAAEMEEKRRAVEHQSEQTDQARTALEQLRAELGRIHRETLEIRLATEELWANFGLRTARRAHAIAGAHPQPAGGTLSRGEPGVAPKNAELEELRGQLAQQYEKLVRQKRSFDAWAEQCREDVQQQAAELQAQSKDLDRRKAEMGDLARRAQAEKLELQQELRRLRAKLVGSVELEPPV